MNITPLTSTLSIRPASAQARALMIVRALCRRRIIWLDHLAELVAANSALADVHARALADLDAPEAEAAFLEHHSEAQERWLEAEAHASWIFEEDGNRLRHLAEVFDLSKEERQVVLLCFAAAVDPSLAPVFRTLSGADDGAISEALAARLFGCGREAMWWPGSPLGRWHILETTAGGALQLDPYVLSYLRGASDVAPDLINVCQVINDPPVTLETWPVDAVAERVIAALQRGLPARVQIIGQPLSGRKSFAAAVSLRLGRPLAVIDTGQVEGPLWSLTRMRVQRLALLHNSTVAWAGAQALRGIEANPGALDVEFTLLETQEDIAPSIGWHEERVKIPGLTSSERKALWRRFLPATHTWQDGELDHLAERFRVTIGEIRHVAAQGDDTFKGVRQRTRELSHGKLGELARLIDCPFVREDLHLPQQVTLLLDEFLFEAQARNAFWEKPDARRLFPRGVGLIGLLSGPPGTGKTMAAQVIAAELGLDLFRIDVASMIDKYIGETAKRLQRLFARATEINAVLLFDEADALFARRTETRDSLDKHSNADTSYLLQLVEEYPGVALLATNKRQQIDDAFVRRIRYVFYLPRPEREERFAIWHQVVVALSSPETAVLLDGELRKLAADVPMTGAQIKNAALAAVFLAQRDCDALGPGHLARALERQLVNQGGSLSAEQGRLRR
jgi:hypothetical protein